MADLPSNIQKINDIEVSADAPISESLLAKMGANINALIDYMNSAKFVVFKSNGLFLVPNNVQAVLLVGCGGGSGGHFGGNFGGTGTGGLGAPLGVTIVPVVPGATYPITIGAGGSGGTRDSQPGLGGNTTFGSLVTFYGAAPDREGSLTSSQKTVFHNGTGSFRDGGPGPFGPGGLGGGPGQNGAAAPPNSGAGGGGGGSATGAFDWYAGGAGGSGILYVVLL